MYIATIPNRKSPPAVLLRESYREGGKVKKRTLANLSALSDEHIEVLRRSLKGETLVPADEGFEITRSRPHGHVAAVLGTVKRLGLEQVLSTRRHEKRDRVVAMIVARLLEPRSKLATARALDPETLSSSLAEEVGVGSATADELYEAMDWLVGGQERIEKKLAARHLEDGGLVLWDVSSTYFEGRKCPLAAHGYSRDRRGDRPQIVFGLLTTAEGCPVAVEVFPGNTADPGTVGTAVERLTERFGRERMCVVGDRGMITQARITEELEPRGLDWISSLRAPQVKKLWRDGPLQLSLFDEQDLAEITSPDFPDERLVACRNPLLAEDRARKREELLEATERKLEKIAAATRRPKRPLRGADRIGVRVGRVLQKYKVGKHFDYEITDSGFTYRRNEERIAEEAALDGLYVVRTSLAAEQMTAEEVVGAYKRLSQVERAFRAYKGVDLKVRPIYHWRADRVRAHVFLCMLAYYVEFHMRQRLAPILSGEQGDGQHSFPTLLSDLATLTKNTVRVGEHITFDQVSRPTEQQQRALDLLDVKPRL